METGQPQKLFEIGMDEERFSLWFRRGEDNRRGDVSGVFETAYQCRGTESRFACDLTIGNLYVFWIALDNAFDLGEGDTAVLKNDGGTVRSELTFRFDHRGHCIADGRFQNQDNQYRSGIFFSGLVIDNIYINEIIMSMQAFFDEVRRIQGHGNFW